MTRRIVHRNYNSIDHEKLLLVTVYEEGVNKQDVKMDSRYCKHHQVLVSNGSSYEFLKRA